MTPSLAVRNLTPTPLRIKRVETFEDPNTVQTKASGYFFSFNRATSSIPTSPKLNEHARSFRDQDLDVIINPYDSFMLQGEDGDNEDNATTISQSTLRLTLEIAGSERYRVDTHPTYTQKSCKLLTAISSGTNSTKSYRALFHPTAPIPNITILPNDSTRYETWMSDLPDQIPLSALSIPGTHNSHTHYRGLPSVRCQLVDVATQLAHGIRMLDIRVQPVNATDPSKRDLYLVHGAFPVSLTGPKYLEPVLKVCYAFLDANPSETIIISLKREGTGSSTDEHLSRILQTH